jgi:hypothetical protein
MSSQETDHVSPTGAVAGLVGIESGVVSGLINPNDSALKRRWRPRHGEDYHEVYNRAFGT